MSTEGSSGEKKLPRSQCASVTGLLINLIQLLPSRLCGERIYLRSRAITQDHSHDAAATFLPRWSGVSGQEAQPILVMHLPAVAGRLVLCITMAACTQIYCDLFKQLHTFVVRH